MKHIATSVGLAWLLLGNVAPATANVDARPAQQSERGKRIFHGFDAVPGTIQRNGTVLPAHASKCINCHSALPPPAASTGTSQYLSAATMSRTISRRGGPASLYDLSTFCNAVRSGIDPAGVVLESKMPRYAMSDAQCADLWMFLSNIK
jgi:hypothetical protein